MRLSLIGISLALLTLSGCGKATPADEARAQLQQMNEMATLLEGVKDKASAEAAVPKIDKLAGEWKNLGEKMKALNLPKEEMEKLRKEFGEETRKAESRLTNALLKLTSEVPDGYKLVNDTLNKHGLGHFTFGRVGEKLGTVK